jgi:hypothetical protein
MNPSPTRKTDMTEAIKNQVANILGDADVDFSAIYSCSREKAHGEGWAHDVWEVAFTHHNGSPTVREVFEFKTGAGLRKDSRPQAPSAADVLYCLLLDAEGATGESFPDWCETYGYDSDSRKALATYLECQAVSITLRRVFDHKTREALREALQDY